jgi:UTP--glucose-1-phosphate uridylyltransferase
MSIRKAVIPIAGLGTRLFPASHACKKEFFPVIGQDGIARPLLHYQVMDLLDAGIEQICIIVRPGDQQSVVDYFKGPDFGYLKRLEGNPQLAIEAEKMKAALKKITFAEQKTQDGFGHAVLQSKEFAGNDPFLLCLGDHLFRGVGQSPHRLLMDQFQNTGEKALSAVNRIHASALKGYGTIAGFRIANNPTMIDISLIIEKPSIQEAEEKCIVDGLLPGEFLGWFGMHVFPPSIFDILEEMVARNWRQKGEFQLTAAQELLRRREGCLALEMTTCKRFDFGTPADYLKSIVDFSRSD